MITRCCLGRFPQPLSFACVAEAPDRLPSHLLRRSPSQRRLIRAPGMHHVCVWSPARLAASALPFPLPV
jgi:hypothetical protein